MLKKHHSVEYRRTSFTFLDEKMVKNREIVECLPWISQLEDRMNSAFDL